jgi:hypothetical protein
MKLCILHFKKVHRVVLAIFCPDAFELFKKLPILLIQQLILTKIASALFRGLQGLERLREGR